MVGSEDRCGYVFRGESSHCCWRKTWEDADNGRCLWHADVTGKPERAFTQYSVSAGERLDGSFLRGAALNGVVLSEVTLAEADLSGVDAREVDLSGTNLEGASLIDADLRGANLEGAKLYQVDHKGVRIDGRTEFGHRTAYDRVFGPTAVGAGRRSPFARSLRSLRKPLDAALPDRARDVLHTIVAFGRWLLRPLVPRWVVIMSATPLEAFRWVFPFAPSDLDDVWDQERAEATYRVEWMIAARNGQIGLSRKRYVGERDAALLRAVRNGELLTVVRSFPASFFHYGERVRALGVGAVYLTLFFAGLLAVFASFRGDLTVLQAFLLSVDVVTDTVWDIVEAVTRLVFGSAAKWPFYALNVDRPPGVAVPALVALEKIAVAIIVLLYGLALVRRWKWARMANKAGRRAKSVFWWLPVG